MIAENLIDRLNAQAAALMKRAPVLPPRDFPLVLRADWRTDRPNPKLASRFRRGDHQRGNLIPRTMLTAPQDNRLPIVLRQAVHGPFQCRLLFQTNGLMTRRRIPTARSWTGGP